MPDDPSLLRTEPVIGPLGARCEVRARGRLVHLCPYADEADVGTVTVWWRALDRTIELHSLAAWLATFAERRISHEEVTAQVRDAIDDLDGVEVVRVLTEWTTAGLAVNVDLRGEVVTGVPR